MTSDPVGPDRQGLPELIEFPPEILVLDRLVLRSFPALGDPVVQPLRKAIDDVFAVAVDIDCTASLKETQALDDGEQFHPVVRGRRFSPVLDPLFSVLRAEDVRPATRPWIHGTGAISKERKNWSFIHSGVDPMALGGPVTMPIASMLPHGTRDYMPATCPWSSKLKAVGLGRRTQPWYTARLELSTERF